MIRIRRSAALIGLFIASVALAAQDGVLLRRALVADATEVYTVETKAKQTVELPGGMGEQEIDLTTVGTYSVKTGKVDSEKGTAAVSITYTVDKLEAGGMLGAMMGAEKPQPMTFGGTVDARGKFNVKAPQTAGGLASMLGVSSGAVGSNIAVELPEKAVKVGDAWTVEVAGMPGQAPQKLNVKLTGEKTVDGVALWVVTTEGKFNIDTKQTIPNEPPSPMAGQTAVIKGTIEVKGEGLIDKKSGKTVQLVSTSKSQQTTEIGDAGISVSIAGTTTTTSKLKK